MEPYHPYQQNQELRFGVFPNDLPPPPPLHPPPPPYNPYLIPAQQPFLSNDPIKRAFFLFIIVSLTFFFIFLCIYSFEHRF